MASGSGKASMSMVTAEALKDHQAGLRRWSYACRSAQPQQRAGPGASAGNGGSTSCSSSSRSNALPSSGRGAAVAAAARRRKAKQQEEELRTVMYLCNWGPNN